MRDTSWTRKGRRAPWLAALLALALAALGAGAHAAAAASPCGLPDALKSAGLLQQAAGRYHELARRAGGLARAPACVERGLEEIRSLRHRRALAIRHMTIVQNAKIEQARRAHPGALGARRIISDRTRHRMVKAAEVGLASAIPHLVAHGIDHDGLYGLELARVLKRAHYPTVAEAVVAATVAAHPGLPVPRSLRSLVDQRRRLAAVQRAAARKRAARRQVRAAVAYQEAGLDSDAEAALKRAIRLDPRVAIPDQLKSPTRNESWWNTARGRFGPWLRTFAEMLIAALAIAVLALLAGRSLRRFRVRLVVEPFSQGRSDGGDDGASERLGAATAAALRENYGRMMRDGGSRLRFIRSAAQAFPALPPQIAEAYPPAGVIAALLGMLDRLLPARTRSVSGELRPRDPVRGVGLTITFGRRYGKVFDETTLWEGDYGTPLPYARDDDLQPAYDRVALPAAAWVTFAATRRIVYRRLLRVKPFNVLGTTDWRSYALFAVGADQQEKGNRADARRAYERALGRDDGNRGAAFNLAALELQSNSEDVRRVGTRRLRALRREIRPDTSDEQWYRVHSLEAVTTLTRVAPKPYEARKRAVWLCSTALDRRMRLLDHPLMTPGERELLRFLDGILPGALIFLASALLAEGRPGGRNVPPITLRRLRILLHDLARWPTETETLDREVTHTALAAFASDMRPPGPDELYNRACYELRVAASGGPPPDDAPPEPPRDRSPLPEGDRLWWEVGALLEEAIRRGGPSLAHWALYDRALLPFTEDEDRRARLQAVVDEVIAGGGS
ncbi:MAG: hypothetical protein ACTHOE_04515 [Conexibacter sp.]